MPSRVLVIGGGLAGAYVGRALAQDGVGFDLMDPAADATYVETVAGRLGEILPVAFAPETLPLAAAYSHVVWAARPESTSGRPSAPSLLKRWARARGDATLVYVSSLAVYGACGDESAEDSDTQPHSAYGRYKLAEETELRAHATDFRALHVVRSTGLFGALALPRARRSSAPAIDSALRDYLQARPVQLRLWHHRDQYLFAGDLAQLIVTLLGRGAEAGNSTINAGPGFAMAPNDVARELQGILQVPIELDVEEDLTPSTGVLSVARAASIAGFTPCSFAEGLRQTLADLRAVVSRR